MLRQIQYFHAVVQHHSFSKAAEECHLSQSAMSQQIKALELFLGFPLLERKNRSFSLTLAGKYFYQKSLILIGQYESICKEARKIATGNQATLKIGVLRNVDTSFLLDVLETFSKTYPHVFLEILSGNHEDLFEWLRTDRLDIVFNDQRRAFSEEYVNLVLTRSPFQLEVAKHHPLADHSIIEISSLKEFSCLIISSFDQQEVEQTYFQTVIGFPGEFSVAQSLEEAKLQIMSSQKVWPRLACEPISSLAKRIELRRQGKPIFQTLCLFWKKENSGYYVEEFADLLQAKFQSS